jgi:hypothetical protein
MATNIEINTLIEKKTRLLAATSNKKMFRKKTTNR